MMNICYGPEARREAAHPRRRRQVRRLLRLLRRAEAARAARPASARPSGMGICHAYTPDGRCVSLLKILLTN